MVITSTNPSRNYEIIGSVEVSSEKDIKDKVAQAHTAKKEWHELGVAGRVNYLQKVYDALWKRRGEITELASKEMGFPQKQQDEWDLGDGFHYFKWYLENAENYLKPEITLDDATERHTVYLEPAGVVAVIQPWNFPFCQWSWSVVPNLVVGNPVVFKHSEECVLTGKLIDDIIKTCALPAGVFSEVYGDGGVGEILLNQDIDLVAFTGSTKTGKLIYELAGKKFIRALLEMGGSAPGIIFGDVNTDEVVQSVFSQRFMNNGQCCDGLKRLVVHKSIFNEVVEKLKRLLESKTIGDASDSCNFGPLSAKRQLDLLIAQVSDALNKGAEVITGGNSPKDLQGAYYLPTILTGVKPDMRVWQEEVFGPVLPVVSFETEAEAVALANDTEYGLGSYIFSNDHAKAKRVSLVLEAGMVSVNGTNYVCPFNPFGGYKKSGMGRLHGKFGFHDLTQVKIIAERK